MHQLWFRLVKHLKMIVWISVLWMMNPEQPFILSDSFRIRVYVWPVFPDLSGNIFLRFIRFSLFNLLHIKLYVEASSVGFILILPHCEVSNQWIVYLINVAHFRQNFSINPNYGQNRPFQSIAELWIVFTTAGLISNTRGESVSSESQQHPL